jgi:hypothetical protein
MSAAPANGAVLTVYSVAGAVAGSNFGIATMTGDNSDTTLTLPFNPVNENNVQVYMDGVYQNKDTFSVSGTTLTFSTAPPTGTAVEAMIVSQTSVNTATILKDADEDTKVEVEQSTDEDKIRFTTGGTQAAIIDDSQRMGIGVSTMSNKLVVGGTEAADTTYLRLQNTPATAATHKVAMEFWGNEGTADASTFNMGRIYGEFDGSSYATTRLTLGSASGGGTFNDEINIKNNSVSIGTTTNFSNPLTTNISGGAANGVRNQIAMTHTGASTAYHLKTVRAAATDEPDGLVVMENTTERLRFRSGNATFSTSGADISSFYNGAGSNTGWGGDVSGYFAAVRGATNTPLYVAHSSTGSGDFVNFLQNTTSIGTISTNGSTVAYNTSSDYRLKENVVTDWDATTRLKQLRPSRFNFIADADTTVDGFLAHEVSDIVPEAVTGAKDATETLSNVVLSSDNAIIAQGITEDDWTAGKADAVLWAEEDELPEGVSVGDVRTEATYPSNSTWQASYNKPVYQGIDQAKLVPLLVKTIQELEARITTLENA